MEIMEFNPETPAGGVQTEMMVSRQAQEVQAAMVVAKRFPRDENRAFARIIQSCQRRSLAERAIYEYPRGGERVTGASIRLAEAMAQNWGNLDYGFTELESRGGESVVMAYCWDLETNTRQTKIFTVPHVRQTKRGVVALTDPRDIYEIVANQAARRVRACVLGVIPGDIVDAALEQCNKTLSNGGEPVVDRVRKMVTAFQTDFSIPKECLEQYIGCKTEAFTVQAVVRLGNVYNALKEGRAKREDYFTLPKNEPEPDALPEAQKTVEAAKQPEQVALNDL